MHNQVNKLPKTLFNHNTENHRVELHSPTAMPHACSFLWNKNMVLQMNCRGYAVAQFMQPEPAKYSHAPNIEAKTFIQPEHSYYAQHPGRFFYLKDEATNEIFSAPYEPVRQPLSSFCFSAGQDDIQWVIECLNMRVEITVSLSKQDCVELWTVNLINLTNKTRKVSFYPYFSIGYMSWMNQSANYDEQLNAVIGNSVTPYQKVADYFRHQSLKDNTFLLAETKPTAWCANQTVFEGEGGLHNPDALQGDTLKNNPADYQMPVAVMQYQIELKPNKSNRFRFLFGPALDKQEIAAYKEKYFGKTLVISKTGKTSDKSIMQSTGFDDELLGYKKYIAQAKGCIEINSPDTAFNEFVNHWLPRQVFYHGDVNRLSTDPQTRNYLQDALGMCFIDPTVARNVLIQALSQQSIKGEMPDGILIHPEAELKYINQVPHADHCVWLPILLSTYLAETNDESLLNEMVGFRDNNTQLSVEKHLELAMKWLVEARDDRGLSYIAQGDWCDPMNMVGYQGKGVSAWLTMATSYALQLWLQCCQQYSATVTQASIHFYEETIAELNTVINQHFWKESWFARGINDVGRTFGIAQDKEGSIYLNPQSWSILCGAANSEQIPVMLKAIENQLDTPFGTMMLAPSYTKMDEGIGRLTQKFPGVSENGSVYNHAAAFYGYSLYQINKSEQAFELFYRMIPNLQDSSNTLKRGQLPNFIPNYYRGAFYQLPETAGRSSHLFNTGTIAWVYRCFVEHLCGLQGDKNDLVIDPQLPNRWDNLTVTRQFRGATIILTIERDCEISKGKKVWLNNKLIAEHRINNVQKGEHYNVVVKLPKYKSPKNTELT